MTTDTPPQAVEFNAQQFAEDIKAKVDDLNEQISIGRGNDMLVSLVLLEIGASKEIFPAKALFAEISQRV